MYNERILHYFQNMENAGRVKKSNAVGKAIDEKTGETLHIFLRVDESGKIEDASYKAFGSVLAIAVGSLIASLLKDKHIKDAVELKPETLNNFLGGVDEDRKSVLELGVEAILNSLKYYYEKLGEE